MLDVRRSGASLEQIAAEIQGLPTRVIPYAAATALTKAAKRGQQAVIDAMRVDFNNPVAYTLNATRIEPAFKDRLWARIAVKNQKPGRGVRPESYLLPEVEGGDRQAKGLEVGLRAAGILRSNEFALPGSGVQRDAFGNVSGATVRSILKQVARPGAAQRRSGKVFAGEVGRRQTRGIWQREDRRLKALFIFTTSVPSYTPRLDFEGAARQAVDAHFATDFSAAALSLMQRYGR